MGENRLTLPDSLQAMLEALSACAEVEALVLAGAHGRAQQDPQSDYDLYCYLNAPLDPERRRAILAPLSSVLELNNQFWETEDDGVLRDGTDYEILYRDLGWLESMVERVANRHQAETGYSTCFWANLLQSRILFDRQGAFARLQQQFQRPYPPELQRAIIAKNWPLLTEQLPAYSKQIAKALGRQDRISVNHRLAAFLASYADILFAANQVLHPGEKKLLANLTQLPSQPEQLLSDLNALLDAQLATDSRLLDAVQQLVRHLNAWLERLQLLPTRG